ncbi:MAG: sulfate adenylyltransferase [Thermoplasmata archaeon]
MLPQPHGGRLVDRLLPSATDGTFEEVLELPRIAPFVDQVFDAEKIALGAYSPLEGFQGSEELDSVLRTGRLPNGLVWPIPIVLTPVGQSNSEVISQLRPGEPVALVDGRSQPFAILRFEEKYAFDRKRFAQAVFGTTDPNHPNVADALATGQTALAGKVDLLRRVNPLEEPSELTPTQARAAFTQRGWKNVAAYQTRNVPHTAHEYLQRCTLEREDIDGLFIHPVVGRLKKGDYRPEVILEAYRALVEGYYPSHRVLLAPLRISMRYAGPKAALFLAIVRKNFGCGYYVVGRDQAGVGSFYDPFACHRIFDEFDIGVVPLRFGEVFHCLECGHMASRKTCAHPADRRLDTSQTRIRRAIARSEPLPLELLRPEVASVLARGEVLSPS